MLAPWKNGYDKPRECMKKQRHNFAVKGPYSQSYDFSSRHVWMWELDYKGDWAPKNWLFQIVVLEKTLESPLKSKEINPEGNQLWIFFGRTDADTEAPILWPPDMKSWHIGKTLMLVKIEGKKRRRWQKMRWLDDVTDSVDMNLSKLWEVVKGKETWHTGILRSQRFGHDLATEQHQQKVTMCSLGHVCLAHYIFFLKYPSLFCPLSPG